MNRAQLIAFERRVQEAFEAGKVAGPVHLSGGNEDELIEIFKDVRPDDWVFSTWRNHYHALLHGVPEDELFLAILTGKSLSFNSTRHKFYTSAIVGGILPIAVGVAAGIKRCGGHERVWCFVGDMCASIGAFRDAAQYVMNFALPLVFVIEDNGMSTNTPTWEVWGVKEVIEPWSPWCRYYKYERTVPHYGSGKVRHL
jgi:TPP-dependent pyruvate/acetoin dehydrogenase alpha subunit